MTALILSQVAARSGPVSIGRLCPVGRGILAAMRSFSQRFMGALTLDPSVYEEVEADHGSLGQALAIRRAHVDRVSADALVSPSAGGHGSVLAAFSLGRPSFIVLS